jgi:hypothetical protein
MVLLRGLGHFPPVSFLITPHHGPLFFSSVIENKKEGRGGMAVAGVSGKAANAGRRACQAWGVPGLGGACATVRRLSGGRTRRIWARERSAKTLLRVELVRRY